jgi:SAM-dependent methyltransferase
MRQKGFSRSLRGVADRVLNKLLPNWVGDEFLCPVCETGLSLFSPLPPYYLRELDRNEFVHSIFQSETLNLEHYGCPKCGASDRDRLYALYFRERIKPGRKYKMLDIAPAPALEDFFRKFPGLEHRSADLMMESVDDRVDVTDMNIYEDGMFDILLCSHVLEHIPEDRKAIRELYRVLCPGGWGIVMVPVMLSLEKTHEDPSITDPRLRWKYYGQDDHVRMYAKRDFVDRLEEAGFGVEQLGIDHFGAEAFALHGIHSRSVLYVVHKR